MTEIGVPLSVGDSIEKVLPRIDTVGRQEGLQIVACVEPFFYKSFLNVRSVIIEKIFVFVHCQ